MNLNNLDNATISSYSFPTNLTGTMLIPSTSAVNYSIDSLPEKILELEKEISDYKKLLMKNEMRSYFNREGIVKNVKEILTLLDKELGEFGKLVCAGGAIRDLTIGKGIEPKDYDIYIVCGEKCDADKKTKNSNKILEKLSSLIQKNIIQDDLDFSQYKFYDPFPVKSFLYKNLKVQVMYRPEILGEHDLIDEFDWNFSSCFISKQKENFTFGHSNSFPFAICGGELYIIKDNIDFIADMKSTEPSQNSTVDIFINSSGLRNPITSFKRCFDFIQKYNNLYSRFDLSKESIYFISKKMCSEDFSKKMTGSFDLFSKNNQ